MSKDIKQLAKEYADKYANEATNKLVAYVSKHPQVWFDILENDQVSFRRMIDQLVRHERGIRRQEVFAHFKGDTVDMAEDRKAGMDRLTKRFRTTIWRYPLYAGQSLGTSTKEDLLESVRLRKDQVENHAKAIEFEEAVASMMKDSSGTVADQLDSDSIMDKYAGVYK